VRDAALVFGSSMIVNVTNYGIHFALSRKLGVVDYGTLAALLNVLTLVAIPSAIVTMIVVKFVAEFHALDDRAKIRVLSERVLLLSGSLAAVLFLLTVVFRDRIASYFHMTDSGPLIAAAVVMTLSLTLPLLRGVLQGSQDFWRFCISTVTEAIGRISFAILFVYMGFGLTGAFAGSALASAICLVYTVYSVRLHWAHARTKLHLDLPRMWLTTGGVVATTVCLTIMGFIDVPLVKHFFQPEEAGIYGAVSVCGKMLFFLVGFVPTVILPKATTRAAQNRPVKPVLLQGLLATLLLSSGALVAFYVFPKFIVGITYGPKFLPAASYVFVYGLAMAFLAGTSVVTTYKIGMHRFGFVVPLALVAIAEVVGIHAFHNTLWNVIVILLAGHTLAFVVCSLRILEPASYVQSKGKLLFDAIR
jgi:O-antigen/teichoic acid export membrane protein